MEIKIVNSDYEVVDSPASCNDAFSYMLSAGENSGLKIIVSDDNENWLSFIGPHPTNPPKIDG